MVLKSKDSLPNAHSGPVPPAQTAEYTADLLVSLRKIALRQNQEFLAHLLQLAILEARSQAQDTRLPE